ncbi:MAG TPA: DNA primase small subunit domain-containing protein [Nitrososphaerales archaeon]|nr:DNA primase small subunit domain-containing protein [Nitrososphaerales archaeon]
MNERTIGFLRQAYKEYYFRGADRIEFPEEVESREFGYIPFGGGMVRHLSFKSKGEALAEILKQSPSSVYCSNARYEYPNRPIEEKGWLGAELIFDIDATDIPTPCKRGHDLWHCERCYASGKLPRPPKCAKCGGPTVEFHGTCETCLNAAKEHTNRVVGFLMKDFGVDRGAIRVYFSGNRGYHLHIFDRRFDPLDQQARGEIAEYVRGSSLPLSQTIASTLRRRPFSGPQGAGWARRITGYMDERRQGYGGTLQKLVSEAISFNRALVDSSVTTDIHRVFRLAGTLHGNTGMLKMRIESTNGFDPQVDPVVLGSKPVNVRVEFYPRFRIRHDDYGPYKSETVGLPTYAAISILTRGLGEVV